MEKNQDLPAAADKNASADSYKAEEHNQDNQVKQALPESGQPKSGLLGASLVFSVMTMFSRVLGLARDILIASFAGATANADAFFIAFKVPQFLRRLFAEGAFAQAFVPVLSEYRSLRNFKEVKLLVDKVAACLGFSVFLVSAIAVLAVPVVATLFAPGFVSQPEKFDLTVDLMRITFPYLFFITLTGFAGAVLNSFHYFAVPALTPIILNLWLIVAAIYGAQFFVEPVYALAFGVLLAGITQFLFQLPFLFKIKLLPSPKLDFKDPGVIQVMTLMIPALFGVSVSQLNLLLDTVIASFLPTGSVSWLYYSDRLMELPLGVFAIAVSTVILPSLSRKHATLSKDEFSNTLDWGIRMILFISIPASVALFFLAEPILVSLFQYGQLGAHDVHMSSLSLKAYSLALLPMMLIKVLASGFYARKNTKTPVKVGIIAMVSNMVFNLMLAVPLHFYFGIGFVGLAAATGLSSLLNAGLLLFFLLNRDVFSFRKSTLNLLIRILIASTLMGTAIFFGLEHANAWAAMTWVGRISQLCVFVLGGLSVYLITVGGLGLRLRHFRVHNGGSSLINTL